LAAPPIVSGRVAAFGKGHALKVAMIGTGYVGLVSGACFSDFGHLVTCVDKDEAKIRRLNAGDMPIYEPGLDLLVERNVRAGRLTFTGELAAAVRQADAIFIAVGTPPNPQTGFADLSFVREAARQVAAALDGFSVVVTKSTVPIGTGDAVEELIREARPDADFTVVSNPEFLREGAAIDDFKRPDRIIVGTDDARARTVMAEIYRPLFINESPILYTSRRTAELIKYAGNAFLATKVTFINEMADLCEAVGANVQEVARGIGLDKRIGPKFLHAGPGFGGSCFPKDTLALARIAEQAGSPVRLVETVVEVNDHRKRSMADRIIAAAGGDLCGRTVAMLGLTFKPNTNDMREAPSLVIVPALQRAGATIRAFDPEGMAEAARHLQDVIYAGNAYECASGADLLVVLTEWDQFRALDLGRIRALMKTPVIVDLRNIYKPAEMKARGFAYSSIGRELRSPPAKELLPGSAR
jgi:UDPglucose 6-dehydrogenase